MPNESPRTGTQETHLAKYSLLIAAVSLAAGIVCAVGASQGFLDNRMAYCDAITNPCTPEVVPADMELPKTAKLKQDIPSQALAKLLSAVFGTTFSILTPVALSVAIKQAEREQQQADEQSFIATQERVIDAATRLQAHQIIQNANLAIHKKIVEQAAAEHLLEELPELVEHLIDVSARQDAEAQEQAKAEQKEVEEVREVARLEAIAETEEANAPKPDPREWTIKTLPRQYKWMGNFLHDSCLIWANQGGGKSWFVRLLTWYKKQEGYRVIVLDPDSNPHEWQGVESYHDPEDIKAFMAWYVQELKDRYKAFNSAPMGEEEWRKKIWKDRKAISVICEEATTYKAILGADDQLVEFYQLGLTKSRKQEMPLTIVAHNNTQEILGVKGLGQTIDKLLQIELVATRDPETKKGKASGKGNLRLGETNEWEEVLIPHIAQKITIFKVEKGIEREAEFPNTPEPESLAHGD